MKLSSILPGSTAAAMLSVAVSIVHPAAFVWDGGSLASDDWTDAVNWNPNVVPDNDGTAALAFASAPGPTSVVDVPFDIALLRFTNAAGSFNITGRELTVGAAGISNDSAQTQTFSNPVRLKEDATFAAGSGRLVFTAPLQIGGGTLTVTGDFGTIFAGFNGTGRVVKNGAGTLTL